MALGERPSGCPPEVDATEQATGTWPEGEPFPLTALECLWLLRGYTVRPRSGITLEQMLRIPAKIEGGPSGLTLWRG